MKISTVRLLAVGSPFRYPAATSLVSAPPISLETGVIVHSMVQAMKNPTILARS
jgi:hypothetical protein